MFASAQRPAGAVDDLVRLALERRPDVLVDQNAALAAHHFADEPMMRLIFLGSVSTTVSGTSNAPAATKVWNQETVAGVLTWTIYDAGSRYADKHSRDAQAEIAELNLKQLVRNVRGEPRRGRTAPCRRAGRAPGRRPGADAAQQNRRRDGDSLPTRALRRQSS